MAKRKTLKCPKCERKFSMQAHLARHLNSTHASARRARKAKAGTSGPRRAAATARSAQSPNGLLDTLQAHFDELSDQRDAIDAQLDGIRQAMDALSGSVPRVPDARGGKAGAGRVARAGSLKDYIGRVLRSRNGALAPREIAAAVKKAGYKTKSDDLTKAVSNALADTPGVRKVSRGRYTA